MFTYWMRRLLLILAGAALANFLGFAYAHVAQYAQRLQNPFGARLEPPAVWPLYQDYLRGLTDADFGTLPTPGADQPVTAALAEAAGVSLGLLWVALGGAILAGLLAGLAAVRVEPPGVAGWLMPLTSLGLATPSFYLGTLAVAASLAVALAGLGALPLPIAGFGWDLHLLLPALALGLRPAAQIAQVTAHLLADELRRQYVVTARSVGNTWRRIRWRHALRNILAPVVLAIAGAFRFSVGELILVEWLFAWPGLGRLLAQTLLAPNLAAPGTLSGGGVYFLHPALLAALLAVFALLFLAADGVASGLARALDPRLRPADADAPAR